ncbi:MAG: glycosyltransferase [bacterium]|nr:glycosyltransferase [bacterium]
MNKKLVSILIPAYNSEKYIRETLDSAVKQTYENIEIIIIDDGSTDTTGEIVASFDDHRIRYLWKENEGIIRTRNRLLKEAKGEYLAYLDSDDIYLPEKVEEEVLFLDAHQEYALVYCDMLYFFDGKPDIFYRHTYPYYSGNVFDKLLERMFVTNTAIMFRREVLDRVGYYDETMRQVEDLPYFLKMARAGLQFGYLDKRLVHYRLRKDSNTSFEIIDDIAADALSVFEKISEGMTSAERKKYNIVKAITKKKMKLALAYVGRRKRGDALHVLASTGISTPKDVIQYIIILLCMCIPGFLFESMLRTVWYKKNEGHFIPVES